MLDGLEAPADLAPSFAEAWSIAVEHVAWIEASGADLRAELAMVGVERPMRSRTAILFTFAVAWLARGGQ